MGLNFDGIKKHLYPEEFDAYLELKKTFEKKKFRKREVTVFYPGGSDDIINPLLFLDVLLDWQAVRRINLIYVDIDSIGPGFMSQTLKKVITTRHRFRYVSGNKAQIKFKLNKTKIILTYFLADVLKRLPRILGGGFDIYFERAFEIFRADEAGFINFVLKHINKDGLLISDCGFCRQDLLKKYGFSDYVASKLPGELGLYNLLKIYKKK